LADETDTRAQFVVEERGIGISVAIARSNGTVVPTTRIGMETHLHSSSCGKAILAHLPEDRLEWILEYRGLPEKTPKTITDREALFEELENVREENVAFNDEERLKGLRAIGVPVRAPDGTVFGSVSVSGTRSRLDDETFYNDLPAAVGNTANILEINAQI
jgi:DNA-binding IclR family transcriptional regulator